LTSSESGRDTSSNLFLRRLQNGKNFNDGFVITDRASFEAYPWPNPDAADYSMLDILGKELPDGMKFIGFGPGGVLEN